jgi:ketosteroid isomerase-like protein
MGAEADFEVVRRAWDACARYDEPAFLAVIQPDAVAVPFGAAMEGVSYAGHEGILRWFKGIQETWEHFETHPEEYREAGDKLIVYGYWRARGRDSGVNLEVTATWVVEVRDGKVAFWRTFTDRDEAHEFAGLRD